MKLLNKFNLKLSRYRKTTQNPLKSQRHLGINNISNETSSQDESAATKQLPVTTRPRLRMPIISHSDQYHSYFTSRTGDVHSEEHHLDKPPKFFQKGTRDTFLYEGNFHEAVGWILIIAECFAMMPVRGVTRSHPRHLTFSWTSVRTLYCLLFILCMCIDSIFSIYKVLHGPITFNNIGPIMFRLPIIIVCLSALSLARKWPELMMVWYDIERQLPPFTSQMEKRRMADKMRMVFFVGMMLSLAEHLLSITAAIYHAQRCVGTKDPVKHFLFIASDHLFYIFRFSYWLGWYGKLLNVMSTFLWNYMDVFVMMISIGLTSMFQQLNVNLAKFKNKQMSPAFWAERRVQYRNLCILCEKVDNAISLITMVSFSNNLYFICVQLLKSLNKMPSTISMVYFYFSLLFLLGRSLAVSLYSAAIYDESRIPLRILRCVPKESWCLEVKRFAEEISSDLVALSGMKFFHLTRKLVLSVAGTIITYELVLIQFYESTNLSDCSELRRDLQNQQQMFGGAVRR